MRKILKIIGYTWIGFLLLLIITEIINNQFREFIYTVIMLGLSLCVIRLPIVLNFIAYRDRILMMREAKIENKILKKLKKKDKRLIRENFDMVDDIINGPKE